MQMRRAVGADVDSIWELKQRLQIPPAEWQRRVDEGGFLLGVSRVRYAELVAHANVLVLECAGTILGFAVTLPDHVLRATDVWARRAGIEWHGPPPAIPEQALVGYFDQLACVPGWQGRLGAPALALRALLDLVTTGHQHVFATVVREPVHNAAALRLLEAIGARVAGRLVEHHEEAGRVVSDVYHLDRSTPRPGQPWTDTALGRRIQRAMARLALT